MPVDAVLVRRLLRAMERSLRILRELRKQGRAAFEADPDTYADALTKLGDAGVIDRTLEDTAPFATAIESWLATNAGS